MKAHASGAPRRSSSSSRRSGSPRRSAGGARPGLRSGAARRLAARAPEQVGLDGALLQKAIEFASASETKAPRDLALAHPLTWAREPENAPIGPFKERGPVTGIVLRHGYLVAEWGEPKRADMTFSVTKSFLSTTVGLAWSAGSSGPRRSRRRLRAHRAFRLGAQREDHWTTCSDRPATGKGRSGESPTGPTARRAKPPG